jgi:hypothetical protein
MVTLVAVCQFLANLTSGPGIEVLSRSRKKSGKSTKGKMNMPLYWQVIAETSCSVLYGKHNPGAISLREKLKGNNGDKPFQEEPVGFIKVAVSCAVRI